MNYYFFDRLIVLCSYTKSDLVKRGLSLLRLDIFLFLWLDLLLFLYNSIRNWRLWDRWSYCFRFSLFDSLRSFIDGRLWITRRFLSFLLLLLFFISIHFLLAFFNSLKKFLDVFLLLSFSHLFCFSLLISFISARVIRLLTVRYKHVKLILLQWFDFSHDCFSIFTQSTKQFL